MPDDFKPMKSVGPGVYERAFYVAKFEEAIYVLHAFEKKTRKTASQDIKIGQQRYKELISSRDQLHRRIWS